MSASLLYRCETPLGCFGAVQAKSGYKTALCGGEGSYRGLGVDGGGAMLEGVGTVTLRGGGGGSLPHAPDWLDGAWSCLERQQNTNVFLFRGFSLRLILG